MSAHLSDEQFTQYLGGDENVRAQVHLQECEECRAQAKRLLDIVGASRAQVEHASDRHANFWALQRNEVRYALAIRRPQRPTWAIAGVMAALVFLSTFLFQTQEPRPIVDTAIHKQAVAEISDEKLLSEVNATIEQDVPSALAPLQTLTFEREQAEQKTFGRN